MDELQRICGLIEEIQSRQNGLDQETRAQIATALRELSENMSPVKGLEVEIEDPYRLLAELSPDPVFLQSEGCFAYVNPAGLELFGAKRPEDLIGKPVIDLIPPKWKAQVAERIRILNEIRSTVPKIEEQFLRLDGHTIDVEAVAAPTVINGKHGAMVVLHDITERKAAEEALRQSEERERHRAAELVALMDAVPAMIWISRDPECREMIGNRYGYEFLRMWRGANISKTAPQDQISQQRYRNFKDGVEIPPHEMPMQIAAATGKGQRNHEFDVVFDDGDTYHLLGNVVALFDANGHPAGAVGAYIDVTASKQAEMAMRTSEERLADFLESTHDGFYALDRNWRIIYANHRIGEMVGMEASGLIGLNFWEAWPRFIGSQTEMHLRRVMEERVPVHYEIRGTYSNLWLSISAYPTRDGISIFMSDITEMKEAEEELRQAEAQRAEQAMQVEVQRRLMENRERERQEIARELHDGPIQTLVSTIFNTQLAKDVSSEPAVQLEFEQIGLAIKSAVRELREVVNELRPPSLIRFGLAKAVAMHAEDFQEKHPHLQLHLDLLPETDRMPEHISLSLFRIYQEALNNIVRHSGAADAWVLYANASGQVVLEIRDNGTGFSVPEDLSEQTLRGHYGLAGIQERADAIGAELAIHSSSGAGTTLHITLATGGSALPHPPTL